MAVLLFGEHRGGAVLAAVVHDPKAQQLLGVIELAQPLHQPADHGLLIPGRHHQIHRR